MAYNENLISDDNKIIIGIRALPVNDSVRNRLHMMFKNKEYSDTVKFLSLFNVAIKDYITDISHFDITDKDRYVFPLLHRTQDLFDYLSFDESTRQKLSLFVKDMNMNNIQYSMTDIIQNVNRLIILLNNIRGVSKWGD